MATGSRVLSLLPAGLANDPGHAPETEKALQVLHRVAARPPAQPPPPLPPPLPPAARPPLPALAPKPNRKLCRHPSAMQTLELQLRYACDAAPSRHRPQLEAERLALESRHGDQSGGPLTLALCRRYGAAVQEYTSRLEAQQSCTKQLQAILDLWPAMDMAARFGASQLRALRLLPSITLLLERQTEGLHAEGCKASKKPGAVGQAQAVQSRYVQKSIGICGAQSTTGRRSTTPSWVRTYLPKGAWGGGVTGTAMDASRRSEGGSIDWWACVCTWPQLLAATVLAVATRCHSHGLPHPCCRGRPD